MAMAMASATSDGNQKPSALECAICFYEYKSGLNIPKVINCGHTFCEGCVNSMIKNNRVKCSKCGKVSFPWPDGFPTNIDLLSLVDQMANPSAKAGTKASASLRSSASVVPDMESKEYFGVPYESSGYKVFIEGVKFAPRAALSGRPAYEDTWNMTHAKRLQNPRVKLLHDPHLVDIGNNNYELIFVIRAGVAPDQRYVDMLDKELEKLPVSGMELLQRAANSSSAFPNVKHQAMAVLEIDHQTKRAHMYMTIVISPGSFLLNRARLNNERNPNKYPFEKLEFRGRRSQSTYYYKGVVRTDDIHSAVDYISPEDCIEGAFKQIDAAMSGLVQNRDVFLVKYDGQFVRWKQMRRIYAEGIHQFCNQTLNWQRLREVIGVDFERW